MNNMKKNYENPEMEILLLEETDILTASNTYFEGEEVGFDDWDKV